MFEDDDEDDPFLLSQTLARLLRSHARMKTLRALDVPHVILEREAQLRDRYLDRVLALVPEATICDKPTYTLDGVLRAFRDEVLMDLCRSPEGKQMVGDVVSVALHGRWSEAGPYGLPPELFDDGVDED